MFENELLNEEILKKNPRLVVKGDIKECNTYVKRIRAIGFISTITNIKNGDCTIKIMHYRKSFFPNNT